MKQEEGHLAEEQAPMLCREVVMVRKQQRSGLWLATCVLTGVFAGFSLKTIAMSTCDARRARAQVAAAASDCSAGCAWLGVEFESRRGAVRLAQVFPGTPAEAAGLRAGDRILRVDGVRVRDAGQAVRRVRVHDPKELVELTVERTSSARKGTRARVTITARLSEIDRAGLEKLAR